MSIKLNNFQFLFILIKKLINIHILIINICMDNQINSQKALNKYNSNKVKIEKISNKKKVVDSHLNTVLSVIKNDTTNIIKDNNDIINNNDTRKTNEYLLNGICRVCKLADRTCRCLRFTKDAKEIICYCGNKECEFDCGVLVCGCIDICRKHRDYDEYF